MAKKQNVVFSQNPIIQACYRVICDPNSKIEQLEDGWVPDTDERMPYYGVTYQEDNNCCKLVFINSKFLNFHHCATLYDNGIGLKDTLKLSKFENVRNLFESLDFKDIGKLYEQCKIIYNNPKLKTEPATWWNMPDEILYVGRATTPKLSLEEIMQNLRDAILKSPGAMNAQKPSVKDRIERYSKYKARAFCNDLSK